MINRTLEKQRTTGRQNNITAYLIPIILTILSAITMPLALPNELVKQGLPLLSFICLSPFFIAIIKSPSYSFAALLGVIFSIITTYIIYYWLKFFGNYTVFTIGGVMFAYILYFALLAPFIRGLAGMHPYFRPLIIAIAWTYYEYLKSSGFLAFPWALIGHPLHNMLPLIQFVDITGIWGLSFLLAFINALIAEIVMDFPVLPPGRKKITEIFQTYVVRLLTVQKKWVPYLVFCLFLLVLVLTYGTFRLILPMKSEKKVRVVLVQQNKDPWERGVGIYEKSILQALNLSLAGIQEAGHNKPDMIIWSETSFQSTFSKERTLRRFENFPKEQPFLPFLRKYDIPFLVGAPHSADEDEYHPMNSVVLLSPEGKVIQFYGKQHPVPFVESIPFWEIPIVQKFYREVIGIHGVWTTGNIPTVFNLPLKDDQLLSFSTPICFEDVFSDLCRRFVVNGAEMLINLTNVSWSKTDSAELQMYISAKFRAVENKRVLVRSTNSGVTSIIDAKGHTRAELPLFTQAYLLADIPVMTEDSLTFYTRFGDYLPNIFGIIILSLCIAHTIRIYLIRKKLIQ